MTFFQLLGACVNNCGKTFHLEVASREFENEFKKIIQKCHPGVAEKLLSLLKTWAEGDFKTDPQLNLIPSLYMKLRKDGVEFPTAESSKVSSLRKFPMLIVILFPLRTKVYINLKII